MKIIPWRNTLALRTLERTTNVQQHLVIRRETVTEPCIATLESRDITVKFVASVREVCNPSSWCPFLSQQRKLWVCFSLRYHWILTHVEFSVMTFARPQIFCEPLPAFAIQASSDQHGLRSVPCRDLGATHTHRHHKDLGTKLSISYTDCASPGGPSRWSRAYLAT